MQLKYAPSAPLEIPKSFFCRSKKFQILAGNQAILYGTTMRLAIVHALVVLYMYADIIINQGAAVQKQTLYW